MNAGRVLGFAAIGLMLTFCAALGSWWWIDRASSYEPPRWDSARFEAIERAAADAPDDRETWVVAVNPDCSHCMTTLRSIADTLAIAPDAPRLFALVVDTPKRPAGGRFAHHRLDGVFWDHAHVWRKHWGHRVYGEVMRFDGSGRLITHPRTAAQGFNWIRIQCRPAFLSTAV